MANINMTITFDNGVGVSVPYSSDIDPVNLSTAEEVKDKLKEHFFHDMNTSMDLLFESEDEPWKTIREAVS